MTDRSVSAGGNITKSVVVTGDGNTVSLSFGAELRLPLMRKQVRGPERRRQQRIDERRRELDVLDPSRGLMPLLGRETEIAALREWLEAEVDISVHALVGPAGTGKTRLGIGLCNDVDGEQKPGANDWIAGFISPSELSVIADTYATRSYRWAQPTLLVIDYAAQHYQSLGRWLDQLASQQLEEGCKLRILLLEREAPEGFGWWAELAGSKLGSSQDRLNLFWDPSLRPDRLSGLSDIEMRRRVITATLAAAKELLGEGANPQTIPGPGSDPVYDERIAEARFANPLSLVMAGMIAREKGAGAALALRRLDAARHLAGRELDRLRNLVNKDEAAAVTHLAAFNGLVGGFPISRLTAVIEKELNAIGLNGDAGALAQLLQQEFPEPAMREPETAAPSKLGTIQPDLIGEGVVIEAFEKAPPAIQTEGPATVRRAYDLGGRDAATALMRLLQDYAFALEDVSASEAEKDTAERLMGSLKALAEQVEDPEALEPLALALPHQTLVLRKSALDLTERLAEAWQSRADESGEDSDIHRASIWSNNLAKRLSELGKREAALEAAEKAERQGRLLFDLDAETFQDGFANSLNTLAVTLNDLGRREDALIAAEEAVQLRRTMAEARPDAFTPDLAMSLNNLAMMLSHLGRREEALTAAEEAVQLGRTLAEARTDTFTPDLANSLNTLATLLSDLGRREDALAAAEETVQLYRTMAEAQPDAFTPNLATYLSNLAAVLSDLGRREDALAAAEEAVKLYRTMAEARPDAFTPNLAASLNNLANMLSELGRREDALTAAEEAVQLRRTLAEARPDAFTPNLAMSLNNLANRLSELGRREDALTAAEEALQLRRTLAAARPDAFTPDLAASLNNLANRLSALGRRDDALTAAEEAVQLRRSLAEARPDAFTVDLTISLGMISDVRNAAGDKSGALNSISEAIDVLAPVFEEVPQAVAHWMTMHIQRYSKLAQELNRKPDMERLAPILAILQELQQDKESGEG